MQKPKITTADVADVKESIIDPSNPIIEQIERPDLLVSSENTSDKYFEDLAFMEQKVSFTVSASHDKNEPNPILAGVNGETHCIYRGVKHVLPRKFLNALINTVTDVETFETLDSSGLRQTQFKTTSKPSLSIQYLPDGMQDPAGDKGYKWFAKLYHGMAA
jgi:hypothetical protein